jgi:hypothetical protein
MLEKRIKKLESHKREETMFTFHLTADKAPDGQDHYRVIGRDTNGKLIDTGEMTPEQREKRISELKQKLKVS